MKKLSVYFLTIMVVLVLALFSLTGCAPKDVDQPVAPAAEEPAAEEPVAEELVAEEPAEEELAAEEPTKSAPYPDYYPSEYEQIVQESKSENSLLAYTNLPDDIWVPILEVFNEMYPWVEVQTLDLGASEVFERYLSENATDTQTADIVISADPTGWLNFQDRGEILDYSSPENSYLPDWSNQIPGLYTLSTDPILMIYNEQLLSEVLRPTGLAQLAQLAEENPEVFDGKITTYDIASPFGYAINWSYVRDVPGAWDVLEKIGPMVMPEASGGAQFQKLTAGEYVVSYFMSGGIFAYLPDVEGLVGWTWIDDGQPVYIRGIAIPQASTNLNSAKLFLDFLLSEKGQISICHGLTPYRPGMDTNGCERTLQTIYDDVGEENIVLIGFDKDAITGHDAFVEKWNEAFNR